MPKQTFVEPSEGGLVIIDMKPDSRTESPQVIATHKKFGRVAWAEAPSIRKVLFVCTEPESQADLEAQLLQKQGID